jgi:hypothetical protein
VDQGWEEFQDERPGVENGRKVEGGGVLRRKFVVFREQKS